MSHDTSPISVTYVGADGRALQFKAVRGSGTAYDLTGLTVTLKAVFNGVTKINGAAVTLTSAASGECEYTPSASEIDAPGLYEAQLKISDGGAIDYLEDFYILVRDVV